MNKQMFYMLRMLDQRNRAYVIDRQGNKIFFGTLNQCRKFISYMKEEDQDGQMSDSGAGIRENSLPMGAK